jgi:proteasome lid subunit RPN8/RPN11
MNHLNIKSPSLPLELPHRTVEPAPVLRFSPLAWLKLQMFCHASENEIGGFAVSKEGDPLYIERFETVLQGVTPVSVEFADSAVADHFDRCVDEQLVPQRFARIWCHTHPGSSAQPSLTDEKTFTRVFGECNWSVMFILSRTGQTYARLAFSAGPGGRLMLPVTVDWAALPGMLLEEQNELQWQVHNWWQEYEQNVHALLPTWSSHRPASSSPTSRSSDPSLPTPFSLLLGDEDAADGIDDSAERQLWAEEVLELYQLEELSHDIDNTPLDRP